MVSNITSLTNHGLRDWLIQRVSAVVLGVYTLFMIWFLCTHAPMDYATWSALFGQMWVRIFSFLALLSLVLHAWIGVWTVTTDYLNSVCVRLTLQVLICLMLLASLVWGIVILWGVQ